MRSMRQWLPKMLGQVSSLLLQWIGMGVLTVLIWIFFSVWFGWQLSLWSYLVGVTVGGTWEVLLSVARQVRQQATSTTSAKRV